MLKPKPSRTTLWAFVWAAGSHWITLMSGGVVTVAVALYERLSAHNVPVWVYIAILVGFAFCACYLAWRDAVRKATVLEKALKENKRQKLTFQINQKRSLAYIHQETGDLTCIQAAVTLQFKNHEQYPITLEDIVLELYERFDEKSEEKKIGTLMYGEPWFHKLDALEPQEFRGRTLDHGFSDWFKFRSMIAIANDITPEQLDGWKHRLRLTVVAMNQEPLSATLFVDWAKAAEKPTTCFPVWPRSLAMPERYHIIGSSKGDEEVDSQGFVIFTKGTTDKVESSD